MSHFPTKLLFFFLVLSALQQYKMWVIPVRILGGYVFFTHDMTWHQLETVAAGTTARKEVIDLPSHSQALLQLQKLQPNRQVSHTEMELKVM